MTTPIVFTTEIQDKGALALLQSLIAALGGVDTAQAKLTATQQAANTAGAVGTEQSEAQVAALKTASAQYAQAVGGMEALATATRTYAEAIGVAVPAEVEHELAIRRTAAANLLGVDAAQDAAAAKTGQAQATNAAADADARAATAAKELAEADARAAAAARAKGLEDAKAAQMMLQLSGISATAIGETNAAGAGLIVTSEQQKARAQEFIDKTQFNEVSVNAVAVTREEADAIIANTRAREASVAATAEAASVEAGVVSETVASTRAAVDSTVAIENETRALARRTIEQAAAREAFNLLANSSRAAALAATASAEAQQGAAALSVAGIRAQATGIESAEGIQLITVSKRQQAAAQELLNQLGINAVAVTKQEAAATFAATEASKALAAADLQQAEAAETLAKSKLDATAATAEAAAVQTVAPAAAIESAAIVAPTTEAVEGNTALAESATVAETAESTLATSTERVAAAAALTLAAINPLIDRLLVYEGALDASASSVNPLIEAQLREDDALFAKQERIDALIEAQLLADETRLRSRDAIDALIEKELEEDDAIRANVDRINAEIATRARQNAEINASRAAVNSLANAQENAARAQLASNEAQAGARALTQVAGIQAVAPGIQNAEGVELIVVAQRNLAEAQQFLNKLGVEAVAVTQRVAAETLIAARASDAAAESDRNQARIAEEVAEARNNEARAIINAANAAREAAVTPAAPAEVAGLTTGVVEAHDALIASAHEAAVAELALAPAIESVADAAQATISSINPLIEAQLREDEAALAQKEAIDAQIESFIAVEDAQLAYARSIDGMIEAQIASEDAAIAEAEAQTALNASYDQAVAAVTALTEANAREAASAAEAAVASERQTQALNQTAAAATNAAAAQGRASGSFGGFGDAIRGVLSGLFGGGGGTGGGLLGGLAAAVTQTNAAEAAATSSSSSFLSMAKSFGELLALLESYKALKDSISTGIEFNALIENAQLGIAASVNALATIRDAQGKVLKGTDAFAESSRLADDQIEKLYADAARTSTTMERLITSFQQTTGAGLSTGASLDQIRKLTVDATLAAGALNVPYHQVGLTLVQLLEGHAQVRNRLTAILGITQEQVKNWKEQGVLVDELLDRFGKFDTLGTKIQGTFKGIQSVIVDFFQQFTGAATRQAFLALETGLRTALDKVFDFKTGKILDNIKDLRDAFGTGLAGATDVFVSVINSMVDGAIRLSAFLKENHAEVVLIGKAFFDAGREVFGLIGDVASVVVDVVKWSIQTGVLRGLLNAIADTFKDIRKGFASFVETIKSITLGFQGAATQATALASIIALIGITNPWLLAIGTLALLAIQIEKVVHAHDLELQKLTDSNNKYAENTASLVKMSREYDALSKSVNSHKLSVDGARAATERMEQLFKDMQGVGLDSARVLKRQQEEHISLTQAIREETQARIDNLRAAAAASVDALFRAEDERDAFIKNSDLIGDSTKKKLIADPLAPLAASDAPAIFRQKLGPLNEAVVRATQNVGTLTGAVKTLDETVNRHTGTGSATGNVNDIDPNKGKELADARRIMQAEVEEAQAQFKDANALIDSSFKEHQISIAEYFVNLRGLQDQMFDAEIKAQEKFVEATRKFGTGDQQKAQAEVDKTRAAQTAASVKAGEAEVEARKKLNDQIGSMEDELLADTGNKRQADLNKLQRQFAPVFASLVAELGSPDAGDRAIAQRGLEIAHKLFNAKEAQIEMEELKRIVGEGETELNNEINSIRDQQEDRQISDTVANQRILDAYRARKEALQGLLAVQLAVLQANPDNKAAQDSVRALENEINQLEPALRRAENATHQLRNAIQDSALNVINDFFENGIRNAKSFGDAMRTLALSVIDAINQIVSKLIATQIVERLFGVFGGGLGASLDTSAFNAGLDTTTPSIPGDISRAAGGYVSAQEIALVRSIARENRRFATGGFHGPVYGPSTPVDSIPIWVTGGEYVINPAKVREFGKQYFDEINFGRTIPEPVQRRSRSKYASGGLVSPLTSGDNSGAPHGFRGEIGLDPGLFWKHLDTPAGHRQIVNVIRKNAKAVRGIVSQH
jgi:hypothetical protein